MRPSTASRCTLSERASRNARKTSPRKLQLPPARPDSPFLPGQPAARHARGPAVSCKLLSLFPPGSSLMTTTRSYKRVLLKLSGEALMGEDAFGINRTTILRMTEEVAEVAALGVELAIVIGGGNIFRGVAPGAQGMDRATADYMGMMATVMNALALQDALKHRGIDARVQSALNIDQVVEPYIRPKALRYLEEGKAVVFAAGTG